jgi:hypothetical protein
MNNPNPLPALEQTAIPTAIAILQAGQTLVTNVLTGDPTQIALRAGPAFQIFLGSLQLSLAALLPAEAATGAEAINSDITALIAKLKAAQTPAT